MQRWIDDSPLQSDPPYLRPVKAVKEYFSLILSTEDDKTLWPVSISLHYLTEATRVGWTLNRKFLLKKAKWYFRPPGLKWLLMNELTFRISRIGMTKAKVFPLPVTASAATSFLLSSSGITEAWKMGHKGWRHEKSPKHKRSNKKSPKREILSKASYAIAIFKHKV